MRDSQSKEVEIQKYSEQGETNLEIVRERRYSVRNCPRSDFEKASYMEIELDFLYHVLKH